ncbi:unnamed protein product [Cuscuta epithymum]|uniref:Uncharacterized protein n=1 Tax=Cuscuta epithymum TaxID=186058 RepID=A0AAV0DJ38_9ASTE|nr:unnamed protein product [Cuscuta epithymum]
MINVTISFRTVIIIIIIIIYLGNATPIVVNVTIAFKTIIIIIIIVIFLAIIRDIESLLSSYSSLLGCSWYICLSSLSSSSPPEILMNFMMFKEYLRTITIIMCFYISKLDTIWELSLIEM